MNRNLSGKLQELHGIQYEDTHVALTEIRGQLHQLTQRLVTRSLWGCEGSSLYLQCGVLPERGLRGQEGHDRNKTRDRLSPISKRWNWRYSRIAGQAGSRESEEEKQTFRASKYFMSSSKAGNSKHLYIIPGFNFLPGLQYFLSGVRNASVRLQYGRHQCSRAGKERPWIPSNSWKC